MSISDKIGGLKGLSWIWDYDPLVTFFIVLAADFGIIFLLMMLEKMPPWERQLYYTFKWNDTIIQPIYASLAVVVLRAAPPLHGWYTSSWWHWTLLVAGFAISIGMEIVALRNGQYTWSQELSPSKVWHTLIFGIVFYWMISSLIPVFIVHEPQWAMIAVGACLFGWGSMLYLDATSPLPWTAHLEGSWSKWDWHVRPRPDTCPR